jgi:TonB family protein
VVTSPRFPADQCRRSISAALATVLLAAAAACAHQPPSAASAPATVDTPRQLAPPEGAILTFFPRTIDFEWSPAAAPATYGIEVDCYGCCEVQQWCTDVRKPAHVAEKLRIPKHTYNFPGDQPGRWRVWAVSADGRAGAKSAWREFVFTKQSGVRPNPGGFRDPASGTFHRPEEGAVAPQAVYSPAASYTRGALRDKLSGSVMLTLIVDARGRVERATVTRSLRPDLDEEALATARQWRFQPAQLAGQPAAAEIQIEMTFRAQ